MMIWLDFFLQLFVQALAWCCAIVVCVVVVLVAVNAWQAVLDWRWRRRQARGLSQRIARL